MTKRLWNWMEGYLTIRLRGPGLESFLNKMAAADLTLWQLQRLTGDVIILRLPLRQFRKIRPLVRGANLELNVFDRHGLPFLARKFKSRWFLLLGLAFCILTTLYLANFIWFVEIWGASSVPGPDLKVLIEKSGLKVGARKSGFSPKQLERALLANFESLVWAEVSVKGVRALVNLAEKAEPEFASQSPGGIYASQPGLVSEVLLLRGTALVEKGDTVRRGDLLISGAYYDSQGKKQMGRADGIVKARIWHQSFGEAAFQEWVAAKTGVRRRQYSLQLGFFLLPLGRSYPSRTHLKSEREWCLSLGRAMLPLAWKKIEYAEVAYQLISISREEARQKALEQAWKRLEDRGVELGEIQEKRVEEYFIPDSEGLRIILSVEVEEDIGEFRADP
ncbi:MAG: sporulation protein YqfD [Firmicutes bacterium]|nr:sporulation protein YqfD [Bacillota bacterium]